MENINIKVQEHEIREFIGNKLENGIKNINILDPNLEKTYVRVSINIGSLHDPIEYQGLAHFLEHMLFLGSKKYPNEDEFESFISENGGSTNAYTSDYFTIFYFDIFNDKLEKALDIFSRFFIDPLFDVDSVNREINAIESEHNKNINSDIWRIYHLIKISSKKDSAINKFSTGNLESLNKPNLREEMIKFYKKFYIPSNLCIVTASSLDQSKVIKFINNSFSTIKEKKLDIPKIVKPFFESKISSYFIKSVNKGNQLIYYWDIPIIYNEYLYTHSNFILSEIINSSHKKSLSNFLIKKGLIYSLYSYAREQGIFIVFFNLVNINDFSKVDSYFKYYMANLVNQNWDEICNYYKKTSEVLFKYNKNDTLSITENLAEEIHLYPLEDSFYSSSVITQIDVSQINDLLTKFLVFNKVNILLASDSKENIPKDIKIDKFEIEKYYGFEYAKIDLKSHLSNKGEKLDFEVISENPFLNINPKFIKKEKKEEIPHLIVMDYVPFKIWFGSTFRFNEIKVFSNLSFINPEFVKTLDMFINFKIFLVYFFKKLTFEFTLQNEIGFYTSNQFNSNLSIFNLQIIGYNDKFKEYFNLVLNYLYNFKGEESDYLLINGIISEMKEDYQNINYENPWSYSSYLINLTVSKYPYKIEEILKKLEEINSEKFILKINKIKDEIINNSKISCFFYGNITEEMLFEGEKFDFKFNTVDKNPLSVNSISNVFVEHPNTTEEEQLVQFSYYIGKFNPLGNLLLFILNNCLKHKFYDDLRTKQQFGYLVYGGSYIITDDYYFIEKIQSTKKIDNITKAILEFNKEFIKNFSEDDFNKCLETTISLLNEKEEDTEELYFKFRGEIINEKYLFYKKDLLLNQVKNVSFSIFKKFFTDKILSKEPAKTIISKDAMSYSLN